jgi:hypothetical protein
MVASSSKNSGQMARFAGESRSPAKFRAKSQRFCRFSYPLTIITLNRSSGRGQDSSLRQIRARNGRAAADKPAHAASPYPPTSAVSDVPRARIKVALISIVHISFALCEGTTNSDCVCQAEEARMRGGCNQINTE